MEKMLPNIGQHGGPGGSPAARPWRESQATNSATNTATRIVLNSMVVWVLYLGSLYRHPTEPCYLTGPLQKPLLKKLKWSHIGCTRMARLSHSLVAQPQRQVFACHWGGTRAGYKGIVSGLWKAAKIPNSYVNPYSITTEVTITYIKTNQSQKGQLEAMS